MGGGQHPNPGSLARRLFVDQGQTGHNVSRAKWLNFGPGPVSDVLLRQCWGGISRSCSAVRPQCRSDPWSFSFAGLLELTLSLSLALSSRAWPRKKCPFSMRDQSAVFSGPLSVPMPNGQREEFREGPKISSVLCNGGLARARVGSWP